MRTLRSHGYYVKTHGKCNKKEWCSLQNYIDGVLYCQDNIGERSDYCGFFSKPEFIGTIVWTIPKAESWQELKEKIKEQYGAAFVLPVSYEDRKFILKEPHQIHRNLLEVEAVIYTTNEKIEERYGTKMNYYTYRFLYDELEKEIKEINGD